MALTRKMLRAMGVEDEKAEEIIEAHAETVTALKQQREEAEGRAKEADSLREQLEEARAGAAEDGGWKARFEAEHAAFEEFKQATEAKAKEAEKAGLYRQLLRDAGVDARRIDSVMRVTDLSKVEVEDGRLKDAEALKQGIGTEWADFIATTGTVGTNPPTPPREEGGAKDPADMTTAEYMAYKRKLRATNA